MCGFDVCVSTTDRFVHILYRTNQSDARGLLEKYQFEGRERADEFGRRAEGEWVMRMIPEKVLAYKNVV